MGVLVGVAAAMVAQVMAVALVVALAVVEGADLSKTPINYDKKDINHKQ